MKISETYIPILKAKAIFKKLKDKYPALDAYLVLALPGGQAKGGRPGGARSVRRRDLPGGSGREDPRSPRCLARDAGHDPSHRQPGPVGAANDGGARFRLNVRSVASVLSQKSGDRMPADF